MTKGIQCDQLKEEAILHPFEKGEWNSIHALGKKKIRTQSSLY
jgi:hypothetical protein